MYRFLILLTAIIFLDSCNKNETPKPDTSGMFVKFFGGAFDDNGFSVINSNDGGYYLSGSTIVPGRQDSCVYVAKIDGNGNKIWDKYYDHNDQYGEIARDLLLNDSGELLVVGYKYNSLQKSDMLLIKITNDDPNSFEDTVFGDPAIDEQGLSIIQDKTGIDKNYIILGNNHTVEGWNDMFFLKTSSYDTIWKREIGNQDEDDFYGKLKKTQSNRLVWCGTTYSHDASNMVLSFANSFGDLLYSRMFNANDDIYQFGNDMDLLSDEGSVIAGSKLNTNHKKDIFIVRTNSTGGLSNSSDAFTLSPGISQEAKSIIAINDNEFIITGYIEEVEGNKDIYVAKISKDGTILKSATFGSKDDDIGLKILKANSGGYFIVGTIYAANNSMIGAYKLDDDLKLIK